MKQVEPLLFYTTYFTHYGLELYKNNPEIWERIFTGVKSLNLTSYRDIEGKEIVFKEDTVSIHNTIRESESIPKIKYLGEGASSIGLVYSEPGISLTILIPHPESYEGKSAKLQRTRVDYPLYAQRCLEVNEKLEFILDEKNVRLPKIYYASESMLVREHIETPAKPSIVHDWDTRYAKDAVAEFVNEHRILGEPIWQSITVDLNDENFFTDKNGKTVWVDPFANL